MAADWTRPVPANIDLDRPSVARMYDYFLGGAHNFQVDRDAADAVLAAAPQVALAARANRSFLRRAVRYALDQGVGQFLDLGSGIPTVGNVHEIAHAVNPHAAVVYVDNDPTVAAHARALLTDTDAAGVVEADLRDTDTILGAPETRRLIDFTQPVTVLLVSVLHFIPGDVTGLLATLRNLIAPGSQLVISHASAAASTTQTDAVKDVYARSPTPLQLRSREAIRGLFAGLDLVSPDPDTNAPADLVPVTQWRPVPGDTTLQAEDAASPFIAGFIAGVGRKPRPATSSTATSGPRLNTADPHYGRPTATTPALTAPRA